MQKISRKNWKKVTKKKVISSKGAYIELLDCFENAGIELSPEIDTYFTKFN